jgi:hypothetical protein
MRIDQESDIVVVGDAAFLAGTPLRIMSTPPVVDPVLEVQQIQIAAEFGSPRVHAAGGSLQPRPAPTRKEPVISSEFREFRAHTD